MDNQAKVSVIVPVFNAGEKLVPSIESLLNQTLKGIEIIIVNDASTDNSGEVIDQLAKENSNIVPVNFSENKGVHEARLAGLKKSNATWIGFLDADDIARPNMFERMHLAAIEYATDIVICGSDRVTEQRKVIAPKLQFRRSERVDKDVFERFCKFDFGTGMLWNKLFRRSVIEPWFDLHFPWRQNINEDLILNIGCFYSACSAYLLKDRLYEYVVREGSVTTGMRESWAYSEMFKAYALAVVSYNHLGDDVVSKITDMYRSQFSWDSYIFKNSEELTKYKNEVEPAVRYLAEVNPISLSAISARQPRFAVGPRLAFFSLYVWLKSRVITIFAVKIPAIFSLLGRK
jgi:glycosyltransferase involved in cell wall biosynthesis